MAKAPPSGFSQVLPLIVTLLFLGGLGWVIYQIYLSIQKIQEQAGKQMGNKNVVFTKEGLRVNVKQVKDEDYVDRTQSYFVKAWNLGSGSQESEKQKR
ncbi:hypothetical protein QBC46DRAFT_366595 [Diplogelasinospora grovesii]|uniref:Uncharacterized protein n=1 Tax=Diplogelasinospora grovesii TaxID=303347 RepID=A0AAN6N0H5_9PEZI|nr:hypothetical protein QBC46DRAFT_366595 [Diplogelasinospora grovesii]